MFEKLKKLLKKIKKLSKIKNKFFQKKKQKINLKN